MLQFRRQLHFKQEPTNYINLSTKASALSKSAEGLQVLHAVLAIEFFAPSMRMRSESFSLSA